MTAKQKAEELFKKYHSCIDMHGTTDLATKCAIILCNEFIRFHIGYDDHREYWEEVKRELDKS